VKKNRDAFVDVTNGVPCEEARIASATMTHRDANDQVRTVGVSSGVQRLVVRPLIARERTQRRVRSLRGANEPLYARRALLLHLRR
jgi:transcriptional regulator of met regulon